MTKVAVFIDDKEAAARLVAALGRGGFDPVVYPPEAEFDPKTAGDIFLIDVSVGQIAARKIAASAKDAGRPAVLRLTGAADFPDLAGRADDLLVEPFADAELWLRLNRLSTVEAPSCPIEVGGLVIHPQSYEVFIDGRPMHLTFKEYELLKFLAAHPERVWDRQALLNRIWAYDYFGGTRTVDVHIRRLRAKLGPRHADLIQTVRQVGYRFVKSVS
jgi:DNA-binding response OmpR family regulator